MHISAPLCIPLPRGPLGSTTLRPDSYPPTTCADKEKLKQVLRKQEHPQITPEIRRELFSGAARAAGARVAGAGATSMDM